ncbi:hypothetical protein SY84_02580 [Deinococcus soli (ex Cha et al. 2016)]|uniref:Uncharacterized protein n=1 Tax=Deinococcus soli (ex Cha et al. 2016) TaxID=1309411 RepID=A0A0F7JKK6_9DEIO|nr:hypothetical protein SY84_02580 [Deinococcus soli (ex Cha et al. 2016)]
MPPLPSPPAALAGLPPVSGKALARLGRGPLAGAGPAGGPGADTAARDAGAAAADRAGREPWAAAGADRGWPGVPVGRGHRSRAAPVEAESAASVDREPET